MKQEMIAWQWHQLDNMQIICTMLQTDIYASTSSLSLFTGRMLFLTPNQQCQSTQGRDGTLQTVTKITISLTQLTFHFYL